MIIFSNFKNHSNKNHSTKNHSTKYEKLSIMYLSGKISKIIVLFIYKRIIKRQFSNRLENFKNHCTKIIMACISITPVTQGSMNFKNIER